MDHEVVSLESAKNAYIQLLAEGSVWNGDKKFSVTQSRNFREITRLLPEVVAQFALFVLKVPDTNAYVGDGHAAHKSVEQHVLGQLHFSSDRDMAAVLYALMQRDYLGLTNSSTNALIKSLSKRRANSELSPELKAAIERFDIELSKIYYRASPADLARHEGWHRQLSMLTGSAKTDTQEAPEQAWLNFLLIAAKETGITPSERFRKAMNQARETLGAGIFDSRCQNLVETYDEKPDSREIARREHIKTAEKIENSGEATRGAVWALAQYHQTPQTLRSISKLALAALKLVGWGQLRSPKLANACIRTLGEIGTLEAVSEISWLKTRIKQIPVQKEITKALTTCAERAGIAVTDLEEISVPTFGFECNGSQKRTVADVTVSMKIVNNDVEMTLSRLDGTILKSIPKQIRQQHGSLLKEISSTAKDTEKVLTSQKARLDSLFLLNRNWSWLEFQQRYLKHPILGSLARRLIWQVGLRSALFTEVDAFDEQGQRIEPQQQDLISLWHPIGKQADSVLRWRNRLAELGIAQPFRQVHREVYLLTDAERRTATYSNRFAAHIIRQSQFRTLAGRRGWQTKLLGAWDGGDFTHAQKNLPGGGRVEFWVSAAYDDGNPQTMLDSGGWMYLSTDQVHFYRPDATHMPLEEVPPLVFSEIMRDVDLFVGVASVGNDPTWQDGGPGGRFQTYWHSFSFGDLSETAKTRKSVLETLLPRLTKLKDRWKLDEKFLIIKGDIRSYKVHLGSGNILMEPNDQYLCIVPDRSTKTQDGTIFLPFEGDSTLSIILSKAFLLAADTKVSDPTIVRQIKN